MGKCRNIPVSVFLLLVILSVAGQTQKIDGRINIQMTDNDTMHLFTATVTNSVTTKPIQKVELTFYVQRMFGLIKVGNGTTDTTGVVTAEIPKDLRSDQTGYVIFITKVEDNELMNDTSIQLKLKPDFPYIQNKAIPRAMIGHYAPWWLVITFTLIVGTISLSFAYILYLIYRIKTSASQK